MSTAIRFPYGLSNFEQVATDNYVYVDKTPFLPVLENEARFGVFLRPRRFGKSLFLSVLEYYYDQRYKHKFEALFGKYYIGQNPTPLANSFRVLGFDFSGIDTRTAESSEQGFKTSVRGVLEKFYNEQQVVSAEKQKSVLSAESAEEMMTLFFNNYPTDPYKIYLLIDEYDHFTNEILYRDVPEFKTSDSQNGYVRKFYEVIKRATQQGVVNRFFITGVSAVTLDALTSGFNITTLLHKSRELHDLMGFTEAEVQSLLELVLAEKSRSAAVMSDLKRYYNGYKFHKKSAHTLYNSDMVLYFLREFQRGQAYPEEILDPNIMPDYGKLKKVFEVVNWQQNVEVLETILREGEISSTEIYQFSFEREFGKDELVNFLYYLGNLTFAGEDFVGMPLYKIPNSVIGELYWQYYGYVIRQRADLPHEADRIIPAVRQLAMGDEKPFFALVQKLLGALSNRDFQRFDEKYIKGFIMAYAVQAGIFWVTSERELASGGYPDLEMAVRPGLGRKHYEYVLEIKYLQAKDARKLKTTQKSAADQLRGYLQSDPLLQNRPMLRAFTVVVVKDKLYLEKVA